MWFTFALATMVLWGLGDLYYKKSADERDKYSHLKTSMVVGLVMGIHAISVLIFADIDYDFMNILIYLPVASMYILSMTIGYFGLRYLELSISSPIQNSSGAITCILCAIFLNQKLDMFSSVAVFLICLGVFLLAIIENKMSNKTIKHEEKKFRVGAFAILFPIFYSIIDSLGTFFDAYYLDDFNTTPLKNVTEATLENVANTSYELTFLICAVLIFIYLYFIKKEKLEIKKQKHRGIAAICETGGQFSYVYAMSGAAIIAAPMVASYSIVSILLSRIILRERLSKSQYMSIALVIGGIIMLGIYSGE